MHDDRRSRDRCFVTAAEIRSELPRATINPVSRPEQRPGCAPKWLTGHKRVGSCVLLTMSAGVHIHDRELLRRTREGDPEAFAAFYRARARDVLGFLRVRVPSAELAADLMCETFAKALVAVHDADRELPIVPLGWLLTIARNELTDSLRRAAWLTTRGAGSRWSLSSCPIGT